MKAAIYCRLSKEDAGRCGESESIQNQKSLLLQYAAEHGYEVYAVYSDEDYSGADRDRPAFNAMLRAAAGRRFEVVLAKTQSRFTRDMELVEKYLHGKFREWGVRFIAVVDHVDTGDDANKKSRQINGLVNEWYLEDLSANVRSVLTHKRQSGRYIGSFALYGYAKDPLDHNHLVIDPEAAAVVRRIFMLAAAGHGAAHIAQELNAAGVPNPTLYKQQKGFAYRNGGGTPGGQWCLATVHQILRNQTYTGDLVQGRHRKVSYKSKKIAWTPREQWIVVPNTHEPVVDRRTFALVQQMRAARACPATGRIHPLAGKVRCGCCGCVLAQAGVSRLDAAGRPVRYLRCPTRARSRAQCGNGAVRLAAVEAAVLERLRGHLAQYFDPALLSDEWLGDACAAPGARQALEQLRAGIARRSSAQRALYLDRSAGAVSEQQFREWSAAYQQEKDCLQRQAAALEQELACRPDTAEARRAAERLQRPQALTRELVCLTVASVTVFPPEAGGTERRLEIAWLF